MQMKFPKMKVISIRAPRAGGDIAGSPSVCGLKNFNPRPPCGGRPQLQFLGISAPTISIRAPRAGGDAKSVQYKKDFKKFQSAPPVRGATHFMRGEYKTMLISIRAPRAGGDRRCEDDLQA